MKKLPTAIICLSHHEGGMELDALKTAILLSELSDVVLVAKCDTFLTRRYSELSPKFALESFRFVSTVSLSIMLHVRAIIKYYGIKNIIFFGASELKSIYFALLGLDVNLIIRHGTTKSSPKKDFFHRLIYSKVNYHIALGEHLANNVKTIIPFAKGSKLVIVPPSFTFAPLVKKVSSSKLTLLHVGRIVRGKGQLDAIEACEVLYKNCIDFEFIIVGSLSEKFKMQFLEVLESKPYKKSITLIGFSSDVQSYAQKADIFLYPSYGEGFGNAFIEAMGQNLVGITYENTAFVDFKKMGLFFLTCKNRDINTLKSTLANVAQNIAIYREKSHENRTFLERYFSRKVEREGFRKILR